MDRKSKLSKGCLEMKFMKRTKERVEQEEDERDREQLYQDQLSGLQTGSDQVTMVSSYYDCYEYLPCRMSFGGFEPETEKMNISKLKGFYTPQLVKEESKPEVDADHGMDVDVQAAEVEGHFKQQNKNSKVNRFDMKPKKKPFKNDKFNKSNNKSLSSDNHKSIHKGKFNNKSINNSTDNKRKLGQDDDGEDCKLKVPRKFMKPS